MVVDSCSPLAVLAPDILGVQGPLGLWDPLGVQGYLGLWGPLGILGPLGVQAPSEVDVPSSIRRSAENGAVSSFYTLQSHCVCDNASSKMTHNAPRVNLANYLLAGWLTSSGCCVL